MTAARDPAAAAVEARTRTTTSASASRPAPDLRRRPTRCWVVRRRREGFEAIGDIIDCLLLRLAEDLGEEGPR